MLYRLRGYAVWLNPTPKTPLQMRLSLFLILALTVTACNDSGNISPSDVVVLDSEGTLIEEGAYTESYDLESVTTMVDSLKDGQIKTLESLKFQGKDSDSYPQVLVRSGSFMHVLLTPSTHVVRTLNSDGQELIAFDYGVDGIIDKAFLSEAPTLHAHGVTSGGSYVYMMFESEDTQEIKVLVGTSIVDAARRMVLEQRDRDDRNGMSHSLNSSRS